ncbi:uncharacterized protein [Amphiura filiformis]|uniref:uncharacterized protein n=1 Tax=Amphiura filiformis TaxID=82378 RepID=UPI003B216488
MSSEDTLQRVYIWSLPRTMGTALVKCLSYIDGIQIVYESATSAYHYGPDAGIAQKATIAKFMEKSMATRVMDLDINAVSLVDMLKALHQPDQFEMQYNLLKYVKENLDPNVVVIDADDLQSNPSSILRQFCQGVGIPYNDSLLKWAGDRDIIRTWIISRISLQGNYLENEGGFYEVALKSTQFLPSKPLPKRSELPKDIQEVADQSMQSYAKMKEMCLKP